MADSTAHEDLITEFCTLTSASPAEAEQYLDANHWDLSNAATEFFTSQDEGGRSPTPYAEPQLPENYTGPRTLDGRPAPGAIPAATSSSQPTRQPPRGGFATLDSMNQTAAGSHAGHGHAHDDDDDDDDDDEYEEDEEPRDLFSGGEKSGLAVQDPNARGKSDPKSVVNDIIKKAQAQSKKIAEESAAAPPTRFRGTGMTLGGDDAPSQAIPDLSTPPAQNPRGDVVNRVLHLWTDGFSIEDGPLHRFDDPRNAAVLELIRGGRAPIHLMNVQPHQSVDVSLNKHNEAFKAQAKVWKPFSGSGTRLGSPTPSGPSRTSTTAASPVAAPAASITPETQVDSSQPTLTLRIQLANGTRLPARFNTTQTIGDVYGFIARASPDSSSRDWVLATTFPNKDHLDKDAVLGDVPEFKKGGTAVQKWI